MKESGNAVVGFAVIVIALMLVIASCQPSTRSNSYRSTTATKSTSSSASKSYRSTSSMSKSSTTSNSKTTVSVSEPKEGQIISQVVLDGLWTWQGDDNTTCKQKAQKYEVRSGDRQYVIWVSESNKILKVSTTIYGKSKTASSSTSSKKKTYNRKDPSQYKHPEDFYERFKDDFIDYEDAEKYYYKHGGK